MGAADRRTKQKRSAQHRRRAGARLAELGWLVGFPAGDRWQRLDGGVVAIAGPGSRSAPEGSIDGALVARSRRVARAALREDREGLAVMVGDVDRWWAIVDAKLAWCAAPRGRLDLLDHAPPRTTRAARELAARRPELAEAITAASVAWAHEPAELARVVAWLGARGTTGDLVTTIALARLAGDHEAGTDALIALLRVDAPDPRAADEQVKQLRKRIEKKRAKQVTVARSTPLITEWMGGLIGRDAATRRRALAILAAIELAGALAPWAAWEREAAPGLARAQEFAGGDAAAVVAMLDRIKPRLPEPPELRGILFDVDLVANERAAIHHAAIVRLFAALPPSWDALARVRLLVHVAFDVAWAEDRRSAWLWDALAEALERGAPEALLAPWRYAIERSYYHFRIELARRAELRRLVAVLAQLAAPQVHEIDHAMAWLASGLDDKAVRATLVACREHALGAELPLDVARATVAIAETAAERARYARLLLDASSMLVERDRRVMMALVEHCAGWLVRSALDGARGGALAAIATTLVLEPRVRWPALGVLAHPRWIDRYPAPLAPALERLAGAAPDAEQVAARRLATELPDPRALAQEIAVLRGIPHAAKRLANLEARLAAPKLPSPARLARLAARIERTACDLALAQIARTATAAVAGRLARQLGPAAARVLDLRDRQLREIACGLLALDARDRALAARLLAARAGPPPWDLRDDPVNRAFLDRLRARGVDPEPWLDGTPQRASDGLELALCGDPLEVFAMGAHFQTCLSPNQTNFFSVIANAADINKRVLYARRGGRIVGRCLIAITDTSSLLVFNPYCHERIGFDAIVGDFARALAERMRMPIVPRGTVATLLARDWYDDGPRDVVGRFAKLAAFPPDPDAASFVADLRAALGRELDDVTLPLVLDLPALARSPRLIVELVPFVLAATTPAVRIRAAELALSFDAALADRLLAEYAGAASLEDWPAGKLLARLRPSLALAQLRATRTVRRLEDEHADRLAIAGLALAALRRPRQAAALLQLACTKDPNLHADVAVATAIA